MNDDMTADFLEPLGADAEVVQVTCPHCGQLWSVDVARLGERVTCRNCKEKFELRLEDEEPGFWNSLFGRKSPPSQPTAGFCPRPGKF